MKHRVKVCESQELDVSANGNVSYEPQLVQYRCSCGWHTDAVETAVANSATRQAMRSAAHEHAKTGRA